MSTSESTAGTATVGRKDATSSRIALLAAVAAAAAAWVQVSRAQSLDYAAFEELFGEPVTTSVTGSPQRASEVPASMIIITADEIRRSGARDIPGVLSRYVGLDVDRRTMEHADVAVRGYNEAFTPRLLVLVDGRQVYADYYGFTPWSTIPVELESIRQIEVVKGPNGALFGFNAVGGVINVVTFNPGDDTPITTLSVKSGTQNFEQISAVRAVRFGDRAALRLQVGSRRSDEFSTPRAPADVLTDRRNERDVIGVDAQFSLTPKVRLGVDATYSEASQSEVPPLYAVSYTDYEVASLRTRWEADTRFGLVKASLYRNSIEADAYLAGQSDPASFFENDVLVAQVEDVFKVGTSHVLRIAAEYRDNSMPTTPIGDAEIFYDVRSLTAMWDWTLGPSLTVTNAARFDRWRLGREGYVPPELVPFGLDNALWDIERDELSFNSAVVWTMPTIGTLRFSAGRARQLPSLLNLGGRFIGVAGFYLLGVPWLEPTDVSNYELVWSRPSAGNGPAFELGVFRGETENIQSQVFGNVGSSGTEGVEATLRGSFNRRFDWGLSLLRQAIEDDPLEGLPAELTYVDYENTSPERVLKAHLGWARGSIEVDVYLKHESGFVGFRAPDPGGFEPSLVEISSHAALDARFGYRFSERVSVAVAANNLTRSSQRQTSSPEVERHAFATFEYSF